MTKGARAAERKGRLLLFNPYLFHESYYFDDDLALLSDENLFKKLPFLSNLPLDANYLL